MKCDLFSAIGVSLPRAQHKGEVLRPSSSLMRQSPLLDDAAQAFDDARVGAHDVEVEVPLRLFDIGKNLWKLVHHCKVDKQRRVGLAGISAVLGDGGAEEMHDHHGVFAPVKTTVYVLGTVQTKRIVQHIQRSVDRFPENGFVY